MIPGIDRHPVPDWLKVLSNLEKLPLRDILTRSVFYPSCGLDGKPIKFLGGYVHSFVYVDYGLDHDQVWDSINDVGRGFLGYSLLACRDVEKRELVGDYIVEMNLFSDNGRPLKYRNYIKEPFTIWAVFDRLAGLEEDHGPIRFSLLYICGDGAATFQALYYGIQCAPAVVAVIQSGTGFGGNWTDCGASHCYAGFSFPRLLRIDSNSRSLSDLIIIPRLFGIREIAIGFDTVGTFVMTISPEAVCCGPA